MQTRPIFILLGLLAANGVLADAYTWTDEDGIVHYSDRPQPGAKRVALPESKSGSRAPVNRSTTTTTSGDADEAVEDAGPFRYESLEVSAPAPEETLWNIEGVLNVSLALSPALQPGHQVRVYFDGTPRMVSGASFQIDEVFRGVHNIQAEVLDETGKLMIRSLPNRFYVQQNTVRIR
jgi:hypothetical protein